MSENSIQEQYVVIAYEKFVHKTDRIYTKFDFKIKHLQSVLRNIYTFSININFYRLKCKHIN